VTGNFFRVYGQVAPLQGRLFTDDECSPGTDSRVVIVGEEFVKSRFGGGLDVAGRALTLNRMPFTIIAVFFAGCAGGGRGLVFWVASLVMGALLLILLIACTNVTVLQLSRAVERRCEMGIRLALGAPRATLMRMLMTEILMLSSVAGVLSLWVAYQSPDLF